MSCGAGQGAGTEKGRGREAMGSGPTTHAFGFLPFSFNRSWEALLWDGMVVPQCHLLSLVSVSPTSCSQVPRGTRASSVPLSLNKSQEIGKWPKLASLASPQ